MKNPFENRDLNKLLLYPTLSWSSMNQFESYDKEKWYNQYVLGKRMERINEAIKFGKDIGERLATNKTFLPTVPRAPIYEEEIKAVFEGIPLMGHLDGLGIKERILREYKTSANPNMWTQSKVDEWGQITFYTLLIWLKFKVRAEEFKDMTLTAIGGKENGNFVLEFNGDIKTFKTKRTMKDLALFGKRIKRVHKEMQDYIDSYPQSKIVN